MLPIEQACGWTEFALLGTLAERRYSTPGVRTGAGWGQNSRSDSAIVVDCGFERWACACAECCAAATAAGCGVCATVLAELEGAAVGCERGAGYE